jgi:hypothetical protein
MRMSIKGIGRFIGVGMLVLAAAGLASAMFLDSQGVTPRALSRYVAPPATGANPVIDSIGAGMEAALLRLDRGNPPALLALPAGIGAFAQRAGSGHDGGAVRKVFVSSSEQVRAAIAQAEPGDVIILAAGVYRFSGGSIEVTRPGTSAAPIRLRGHAPGLAVLEFDLTEGFVVSAPHWTFQDLSIRGVCADHSNCEHAFHVVNDAHHFASLNNVITDFNAHFKINGSGGRFPDHGRIDGNTLSNLSARKTANPVTLIDLVAASDWIIRRNLISDFIKQEGDGISFGAFAKGSGSHNVFEQNIVWCERRLHGAPGQRVGLSLGGGATGAPYCRDQRCITEQNDSVIQSNLIISCSDNGIYLNSAARSKILQNSLIDTDGVVVRFATSSADVEGNLVEGAIRSRNGGIVRLNDNLDSSIAGLYVGLHAAPGEASLAARPPRRKTTSAMPPDLCGQPRPATPAYGAWEDLLACR